MNLPHTRTRATDTPTDVLNDFDDDDAPTTPGRSEYRAAMLVKAWAACSPQDQAWLERLIDLMAWSRK